MTYKEFKKMILEDEYEPLTIDGKTFKTKKEFNAFIKHLYAIYKTETATLRHY